MLRDIEPLAASHCKILLLCYQYLFSGLMRDPDSVLEGRSQIELLEELLRKTIPLLTGLPGTRSALLFEYFSVLFANFRNPAVRDNYSFIYGCLSRYLDQGYLTFSRHNLVCFLQSLGSIAIARICSSEETVAEITFDGVVDLFFRASRLHRISDASFPEEDAVLYEAVLGQTSWWQSENKEITFLIDLLLGRQSGDGSSDATADLAYEKLLALFFNGFLVAVLGSKVLGASLVLRVVKAFEDAASSDFYRNVESYRIEMLELLSTRGLAE